MPDTSPRGAGIAGEDDAYDFGSGAGFYCDATEAPWKENYNMYSYVTQVRCGGDAGLAWTRGGSCQVGVSI